MANKSGIADNVINLPQGGGAQKGMGETFSPDLFSGTGNFSIPIAVPAGRNGLQPSLTVGYSSGNGNSEFGLGWGLSVPGVSRKTNRGIPIYDDQLDTFILSGAEDLIAVFHDEELIDDVRHFKTQYRPRTEGLFARILHHKTNTGTNYWEVRSKDGLTSYYGDPDATGDENTIIADPENRDHIFAWRLYKTVDVFGNSILYSYQRELLETEEHHYDQLYLSKIEYTNFDDNGDTRYLCSVQFEFEERPDPFSSHTAGFEIRTTQRVKCVNTYTHPHIEDRPCGYDFPDGNRSFDLNNNYPLTYSNINGTKKVTQLRYITPDSVQFDFRHENDGNGLMVNDENGDPQGMNADGYNVYRDYNNGVTSITEVFRMIGGYADASFEINFELLAGDIEHFEVWDDSIWTALYHDISTNLSYTGQIGTVEQFYYALSGTETTHGDNYPGDGLLWEHNGAKVTCTQFRTALSNAGISNVTAFINLFYEKLIDPAIANPSYLARTDWNYMIHKEYKEDVNINTVGEHALHIDFNKIYADGSITNATDIGYFLSYDRQVDPMTNFRLRHASSTQKIWVKFKDIIVRQAQIQPGSDDANYMPIKVKQYDFKFLDERVTDGELATTTLPQNDASILSQVQVLGYDHREEPEKMPPLEFHYSKFNPIGKDFRPITGENLPPVSLADPEYELADLNGNGLPDIVQINGTQARYWRNNGNGTYALPKNMKDAPLGISLAEAGVTLADADGDGRVDLLVNKPGMVGYFTLNPNGEWDESSLTRYDNAPSFSFQDPEVQLMDLSGDGITDVLRNGSRFEIYYHDREEGWNDYRFVNKEQLTGFPNVSFADPRIRIAGLSGGGLQDIVRLENGSITYWPSQGYGKWGKPVVMKNCPRFPYGYNPARIMMADFDGDGLTDLAYIDDNEVTLWINQSGNGWSDPIVIEGTPRVSDMDSVRAVDMMGTGVPGILWSYQPGTGTREQLYYLDLTGGVKPYLLNEMANNMGALTRVQYRTSMVDYLRDFDPTQPPLSRGGVSSERAAERSRSHPEFCEPWKTTLPMPVLVVGKVEVHDLISKGKLVTEYAYHHGYWDGVEREFRGFGRVDQKDTETFDRYNKDTLFKDEAEGWFGPSLSAGLPSAPLRVPHNEIEKVHYTPPMFTRSWFHQGPVQADAILGASTLAPRQAGPLNPQTSYPERSRRVLDWTEVDHSSEYYAEKWDSVKAQPVTIQRPKEMVDLLKSLPRDARRDALRTMRGAVLRTELYGLDSTRFQHKPYTVTEAQYGVRTEFMPEDLVINGLRLRSALEEQFRSDFNKRPDSGYIFFSFSVGQRTTQWERGNDPMTSFAFTADYDAYGQPLKQVAIAVPRYRNFMLSDDSPPKGYSATLGEGILINKDTDTHYLIGRAEQSKSYEVVNDGEDNLFTLRDKILAEDAGLTFNLLAHSLNYYDGGVGDEFDGLALGELGDYGVAVRSEALVATDALWNDAYGSKPDVLKDKTSLPGAYPTEFKDLLPDKGGYLYKSSAPYETGYYVEGGKAKFDFHVIGATVYGNSVAMRDPLDREATVAFDRYDLLPKTVTDPVGMETEAWYDYRLLTPFKAKDPNDNFTEFAFNRIGLLYKSAVKAKYDIDEGSADPDLQLGDYLDHPTSLMEYDFFNFMENGDPVWVKTTQRQYHYYGPSPEFGDKEDTILSCQYSDGFGRLLQTRAQAEEIIYGDATFGDSGLPTDQTQNANCVGVENTDPDMPNVVVNGWTVYNNKGQAVEQYEPYFDQGFDYKDVLETQKGQKVRVFHDVRGQAVRTLNPDNTEQRVIPGVPHDVTRPPVIDGPILNQVQDGHRDNYTPTPWLGYTFDANDLGKQFVAPDAGLTACGLIDPEDSSQGYEDHFATPKSAEIDELGHTIKTTEHMGTGDADDDIVMAYEYDIRGNVMKIVDALDRDVFTHKYDLANQTLWTDHIDSGVKTVVYDLMGRPTEMRDAKGSHIINSYDDLNRPVRLWAADDSGQSLTLRNIAIFGDDTTYGPTNPKTSNHLGMPYKSYDEAGLVEITEYDFKGGPVTKKQQVISDTTLLSNFPTGPTYNVTPYTVDWVGLSSLPTILDTTVYQTDMGNYDAIGRPSKTTLPADVNSIRKEIKPEYSKTGGLKKVHYDGTEYIKEMAFNAKGQPLLQVLGNGVMTRYTYSDTNFSLLRTQSEEYTYTKTGTEHEYAYDTGTKKHNTAHLTDLTGNILKMLERNTDCGLSGTPDQLDRKFKYDPINRLLEATGREATTTSDMDLWAKTAQTGSGGNPAPSSMQAYTRKYAYDKMGNIAQLKQTVGNTFTRNFHYDTISSNNLLHSIKKADDITSYSNFTYDVNGNKLTSGTSRNYVWDYADQLKAFLDQTGTSEPTVYAQYLYSGGQRVKKLVRTDSGGATETTVYIDGVFEHRYDSSAKAQTVVYVGGVATVRKGHAFDSMPSTTYQLSNHLGSVNFRLDSNGAIVDREEHYPFGDSSVRTWGAKRYRYTGKEKDAESGLYYYGARYYSAWICQFLSVDPLTSQTFYQGSYVYADDNPIMMNDPTGMSSDGGGDTGNNNDSGTGGLPLVTTFVKDGDTFWDLENTFGLTHGVLKARNPGVDPTNLQIGQEINLIRPQDWAQSDISSTPLSEPSSTRPTSRPITRVLDTGGSDFKALPIKKFNFDGEFSISDGKITFEPGLSQGLNAGIIDSINPVNMVADVIDVFGWLILHDPYSAWSSSYDPAENPIRMSVGYPDANNHEYRLGELGGMLITTTVFLAPTGLKAIKAVGAFSKGRKAGRLVTVYRGVNSSAGTSYTNAMKGVVKPRGGVFGHSDPLMHNIGSNGTVNSKLTSWTTNENVALNFAYRQNGKGVLLEMRISQSALIKSPNKKAVNLFHKPGTVVSESEWLIKGIQRNVKFTQVIH